MIVALAASPHVYAEEEPVKVFLLAGQSNMVGYSKTEGVNQGLRAMVNADLDTFGFGGTNPLVDADGDWVIRSDVNVYAHNENGNDDPILKISGHTAGLGAWSSANRANFGPEYGFGHVIGNALDEDVLLIKIADGGTTLAGDWRSPSAVAKRGGTVGRMWDKLTAEVGQVLDNLDTHFPEYAGRKTEIVGFGWHQGWNDIFVSSAPQAYEANMADFIRDVQSEYGDDLPFIIATTGQGGNEASNSSQLQIINAQLAMGDATEYPEFEGEVAVIETRPMWRPADVSPNNQGFHWNGNGITMYEIGTGMGEAYLKLVPEPGALGLFVGGVLLTARHRRD
ncbi:MAG: sialate O-acetylesterase [Planctomycetota bacterium]